MLFTTCVLAWHTYAYTLEQEDGPDALEEVANNTIVLCATRMTTSQNV
jgi:hypothetical protein